MKFLDCFRDSRHPMQSGVTPSRRDSQSVESYKLNNYYILIESRHTKYYYTFTIYLFIYLQNVTWTTNTWDRNILAPCTLNITSSDYHVTKLWLSHVECFENPTSESVSGWVGGNWLVLSVGVTGRHLAVRGRHTSESRDHVVLGQTKTCWA